MIVWIIIKNSLYPIYIFNFPFAYFRFAAFFHVYSCIEYNSFLFISFKVIFIFLVFIFRIICFYDLKLLQVDDIFISFYSSLIWFFSFIFTISKILFIKMVLRLLTFINIFIAIFFFVIFFVSLYLRKALLCILE